MTTIPQMRYELVQFTAKALIDFDTPTSESLTFVENIWRETIAEIHQLSDDEVRDSYNYELGNPNDTN